MYVREYLSLYESYYFYNTCIYSLLRPSLCLVTIIFEWLILSCLWIVFLCMAFSLLQLSRFLDTAKVDYRRYGETLFDILFAGGILGMTIC